MTSVRPKDVKESSFFDSAFQKVEMQIMMSCIAITQYRKDPDKWTPFSWDQYVELCDHKPCNKEKQILEAMCTGGTVILDGPLQIEGGYLKKDSNGYNVTEKLLTVMEPYKG